MAEEEPKTVITETPPVVAVAAAGEKEDAAAATNGKRNNREREPAAPVEELFDLSKPIPRVERPKKEEHDAKLVELTEQFEKLKEDRRKVQEQIDGAMTTGKNSELGKERDVLHGLRQQKGKLIGEKQAIRASLEGLKTIGDKLAKDRKDARGNIRFSTVEEIDGELKRLQKEQETTSMSLQDEKKIIKEMDTLKASKSLVKDLKSTETSMEDVKLKRKAISNSIADKDKEIDAVAKEIDVLQAKLKEMSDKETDKRGALDGLFKERETFKKEISAVLKEKDKVRDDFREQNNSWWNSQRAVKAQQQMRYEAEQVQRKEERQAHVKEMEEAEAKKIPYEEEQGLCDYLADYLERTYLGGSEKKDVEAAKKDDVIAVKDDPFSGMKPVKKVEVEYFGKGKAKKKRQRAKKPEAAGPFTLNVDSFEQFGLIGLSPPTSKDMVEKSVKELREKKEWYKQQPRGSVATAKDVRKKNEKNAAKLRSGTAAATVAPAPKGKFSLSNDEFVPLGKGASAGVFISSWGQSPIASAPAAVSSEGEATDLAPTPAEANYGDLEPTPAEASS